MSLIFDTNRRTSSTLIFDSNALTGTAAITLDGSVTVAVAVNSGIVLVGAPYHFAGDVTVQMTVAATIGLGQAPVNVAGAVTVDLTPDGNPQLGYNIPVDIPLYVYPESTLTLGTSAINLVGAVTVTTTVQAGIAKGYAPINLIGSVSVLMLPVATIYTPGAPVEIIGSVPITVTPAASISVGKPPAITLNGSVALTVATAATIVLEQILMADAGSSRSVALSAAVTLDGSGSSDPVGVTGYTWTQLAGTAVTLANGNTAQATFTAPAAAATLRFQLTVTNALSETDSDEVQITVGRPGGAQTGDLDQKVNVPLDYPLSRPAGAPWRRFSNDDTDPIDG